MTATRSKDAGPPIIGTGSTGVQVVPELAKEVAELTVYQRTPIWVLPKFDVKFFPLVQRLFARFPVTQRTLRWYTDAILDFSMVITMWKYRHFKVFNKGISHSRGSIGCCWCATGTVAKAQPRFRLRLQAADHLQQLLSGVHQIACASGDQRHRPDRADGIVANDGTKRLIDTLVLATGFDVWEANLPAIEVIGREGQNLGKWWRETNSRPTKAFRCPFPNFLSMASPYAWVGLSWFNTVEYQMRHMDRLFGELQRRDARTFEVTEEANARFLDRMMKLMEDSAFELGNCVNFTVVLVQEPHRQG